MERTRRRTAKKGRKKKRQRESGGKKLKSRAHQIQYSRRVGSAESS